jgi:hypothetical protein
MMTAGDTDLGFGYRLRKNGEVEILRHGSLATLLRGRGADKFRRDVEECTDHEAQQLMARLTGNYKRGNEHAARGHPRNRG